MTTRKLAEILSKVWAVTLVIEAIIAAPSMIWTIYPVPTGGPSAAFAVLAGIVLRLVAGVAVMVWADDIVGLFEVEGIDFSFTPTGRELLAVAFALVGTYFAVLGFANLAGVVYLWLMKPELGETSAKTYMWQTYGEQMVRTVVQLVAGVALVLGREVIATNIAKLRGFHED